MFLFQRRHFRREVPRSTDAVFLTGTRNFYRGAFSLKTTVSDKSFVAVTMMRDAHTRLLGSALLRRTLRRALPAHKAVERDMATLSSIGRLNSRNFNPAMLNRLPGTAPNAMRAFASVCFPGEAKKTIGSRTYSGRIHIAVVKQCDRRHVF